MINIQEHIITFEGQEYVPLEVVQQALREAHGYEHKLDEALDLVRQSISQINLSAEELDD